MNGTMREKIFFIFVLLMVVFKADAQYYYKDVLLSRQNQENWKSFHDTRVREVNIQSIDANNEQTPDFICLQKVTPDFTSVSTFTKSANVPASTLTAFYDQMGRMIKTVDTSDTYRSTTEYTYNDKGEISVMLNQSIQTDNQIVTTEKHMWFYDATGPVEMIKIKGQSDSTMVSFVKDEKGNIVEEKSVRNRQSLPSVYYYYDNNGRLTDIVRYNQKAGRLLPDYVFEYNSGRLSSMLFVPNGSTDYQRWIYVYDANGLKTNETCYDKKRQVVVKIRYNYTFF
jgi:antitoxin component YwqK of YwqJK toxin-antitoxin module